MPSDHQMCMCMEEEEGGPRIHLADWQMRMRISDPKEVHLKWSDRSTKHKTTKKAESRRQKQKQTVNMAEKRKAKKKRDVRNSFLDLNIQVDCVQIMYIASLEFYNFKSM